MKLTVTLVTRLKSRFLLLFPALLVTAWLVSAQAQPADATAIEPETEGEAPDESFAAEAEALESGATLFPIPRYEGGFFEREALTGDWGGIRKTVSEDHGVQLKVDVNQFYQGVWDGGNSRESDYNGSADYRLLIDTAKAGLWPGGFLEIHGESYWGRNVNGLTGAALPVNTEPVLSQPGGPGTYLSHVVFTQFLGERFAVFLGKLDTTTGDSNRFASGVGDRGFMNLGFNFNPVNLRTVPYSTLGAGFLLIPVEGITFTFSAIDADGVITRSGFDTVFNGNTSFSGELGIATNIFERPGRHLFGFIWSDKDYLSVAQDPRVFVPTLGIEPTAEDSSWAFYYNFDQFLVVDPEDPNQGWGLFGRFGISDGNANIIHRFYSLGLGGTGLIPGRPRDRFGVGYYYLELSDNRLGIFTDDSEQGGEIFYNVAVTPWFELTADLQVVDGVGKFSDTAVVGGLRCRIAF